MEMFQGSDNETEGKSTVTFALTTRHSASASPKGDLDQDQLLAAALRDDDEEDEDNSTTAI